MPEKPDYQDIDKTVRIEPGAPGGTAGAPAATDSPGRPGKISAVLSDSYHAILSGISRNTGLMDTNITAELEKLEPVHFDEIEEPAEGSLGRVEACLEIKEEIARGGQARIITARDRVFNRTVALKSLHDKYKDQPERRHSFLTEAQMTAQLDHPAIVPVYGLYEDDADGLYLAMKLIRGRTLKDYLEHACRRSLRLSKPQLVLNERRLLWQRLEIFLRVCEAISYVHHRQVIHRDLKPENIMIGSFNETYVMDWGIAEHQDDNGQGAEKKHLAGTLQYIAPEVINKRPYDHRSDIFLLGLILYELVYLKPAYAPPKDQEEGIAKARQCRIEPFEHRFGVKVDHALTMIIAKALSPDPEKRYQSVKALIDDLRNYRRGEATEANPEGPVDTLMRKVRNHYKLLSFFSVLMLLLLASLSAFSLARELKNRDREERKEKALSDVYSSGLSSCARFDRLFRSYEALLTSISREASLLLGGEVRSFPDRLYIYDGERNPDAAPPDFAYAPAYRKPVSFSTLVYILPSGELTPAMERDMRLLYPLKRSLAAALFRSLKQVTPTAEHSRAEMEDLARNDMKPPLLTAYLGLESGLHVGYPYDTDYAPGYDPRLRPWYRDALQRPGQAFWGMPYVDTGEIRDIVLTCSHTVMDEEGRLLGVAAADISLARLLDLLGKTGNTGDFIDRKLLADRQGRIIAERRPNVEKTEKSAELKFQEFENAELLDFMWQRENGRMFETEAGKTFLYFFFRIESLDWLYIEKIDFDELLNDY